MVAQQAAARGYADLWQGSSAHSAGQRRPRDKRGQRPPATIVAMGTLHLVRHGQASFGTDDYDRLSDLGHRQCVALGQHFLAKGQRFDAVFMGSLRRHRESFEGIACGLDGLPEPTVLTGLDEYDPEAVVRAIHPATLPHPTTPDAVRQHFRLLRQGLLSWMDGRSAPVGMPSHAEFRAGVTQALALARAHAQGEVLMVSSGGPISVAVGLVLGLTAEAVGGPEPAHPQQRGHRIPCHTQAACAAQLQCLATPGQRRAHILDHVRLSGLARVHRALAHGGVPD